MGDVLGSRALVEGTGVRGSPTVGASASSSDPMILGFFRFERELFRMGEL